MGEFTVGVGNLTVAQKLDLVIELMTIRGRKSCLQQEMDAVLDAGDAKRFKELAPALERVCAVERELTAIADRI